MPKYQPSVIREFARSLYAQAKSMAVRWAVFGGVVGCGVGFLIGLGVVAIAQLGQAESLIAIVIATVLGTAIGARAMYNEGWRRSFSLRLKAQEALCLLQIEENTRKAAKTGSQIEAAPLSEQALDGMGDNRGAVV